MPDKSQTYSVEAMNAQRRHCLNRLVGKTRGFSPCFHALCRVIKLFVFACYRRQLYRQRYPDYPSHLIDFLLLITIIRRSRLHRYHNVESTSWICLFTLALTFSPNSSPMRFYNPFRYR